jgi:hypothetical protein
MTAVILLAALTLGQSAEEKLLAKLDADFERLVAKEPQAAEVRKAAQLLLKPIRAAAGRTIRPRPKSSRNAAHSGHSLLLAPWCGTPAAERATSRCPSMPRR